MALTLIAVVIFPGAILGTLYLALELLSRAIERVTGAVEGMTVTVSTAVGEAVRGPVVELPDLPPNEVNAAHGVPWDQWGGEDDPDGFIADPTYGTFPDPAAWVPADRTMNIRPGQGPLPVDMSAEGFEG